MLATRAQSEPQSEPLPSSLPLRSPRPSRRKRLPRGRRSGAEAPAPKPPFRSRGGGPRSRQLGALADAIPADDFRALVESYLDGAIGGSSASAMALGRPRGARARGARPDPAPRAISASAACKLWRRLETSDAGGAATRSGSWWTRFAARPIPHGGRCAIAYSRLNDLEEDNGSEYRRACGGLQRPHKTVVVVDDAPENLAFIRACLASAGYTVFTAKSGEECLTFAHPRHARMILLDVQMPASTASRTCRLIRKRKTLAGCRSPS